MQQLTTAFGIFVGEPGHMHFTYNIDNAVNRRYYLAGQLVQWSVRHGGPGIPILSPVVYDVMAGVKPNAVDVLMEMDHLQDGIMKSNLKTVSFTLSHCSF